MEKFHLLINLSEGFFRLPALAPVFESLRAVADVRQGSWENEEELLPQLQWANAVLMWSWPRLTDQLLDQCPNLRFCAHIDLSQATARTLLARGLPVSVSRSGFSPAVSEMALTLILSTLRRTPTHQARMGQGTERWVRRFPEEIDPDERQLTGRRVGLVGFGAIGQRLAELLAPFACDLRVHDPHVPAEVLARHAARGVSLDELIDHAEVLVLCAASNPGTRKLLDAARIERLAQGAVLVNVCRAALVDGEALLHRLRRGDLYAALDVFDQEPLPLDSELRRLPNVYLTPHRAGGLVESAARIVAYLAEDLHAFLAGQERRYALTEAMLPALDG